MTQTRSSLLPISLLVGMVFIQAPSGFGQAGRAELTGEVRDSSGGLIPGAKVTATEASTNQSTQTLTTARGSYNFAGMRPGKYTASADAAGFRRLLKEGVLLATGIRTRLDFELAVGGQVETARVQATAPLLRTESGSLGQTVDNRSVEALPLKNRDFVQLVALSTGVALPPGSSFPRINGGRPRVNEYLYDGISVLQPEPGQPAFFPIVDAVEESKVETNSPPAEFGRFSSGVVNLSTWSGGNAILGAAAFGTITSAGDPRVIQFALKLQF